MKAVYFLTEHIQVLFFILLQILPTLTSVTFTDKITNVDLFINEICRWLFWAQITDELFYFSHLTWLFALSTFCSNYSRTSFISWQLPHLYSAMTCDCNTRQRLSFEWTIDLPSSFSTPFFFSPWFSRLHLTVTIYLSSSMCHNIWKTSYDMQSRSKTWSDYFMLLI